MQTYQRENKKYPQTPYGQPQQQHGSRERGHCQRTNGKGHDTTNFTPNKEDTRHRNRKIGRLTIKINNPTRESIITNRIIVISVVLKWHIGTTAAHVAKKSTNMHQSATAKPAKTSKCSLVPATEDRKIT